MNAAADPKATVRGEYAPPAPGVTITFKSVEDLCRYLKLHEKTHEVYGWRGSVLVLRRKQQVDKKSEEVSQ